MHATDPAPLAVNAACAGAEATAAYAAGFAALAATRHFRPLRFAAGLAPLTVSSLGVGTYLGAPDAATDAGYIAAFRAAWAGGINLIDTAINYRAQRSERAIGAWLKRDSIPRAAAVLCSKAGYLPEGDAVSWMRSGLVPAGQLAAGCHCMAPVYLAHQLQASLDNLGVGALDVFYLHNPETQQAELSREEFHRRLRAAFEFLEKAAAVGRIQYYGVATWSGFRVPPDANEYLDLNRMVAIARELAGENHRFRFLQLPYNLAMPEAYTLLNQTVEKPPYVSVLNAAYRLGVHVVASAALASGRLARIPDEAREHLLAFLPPAATDAELALQFVRSTASVLAGLVGMSSPEHVAANLRALHTAPAPPAQVGKLLQS